MKTYLQTAAALILSTTPIISAELGMEIKGGMNISIQRGTYVNSINEKDSEEPLYGVCAGVALPISLMNSFTIQPEILYSAKGYKGEKLHFEKVGNVLIKSSGAAEFKLDYLDLPVLIKYNLTETVIRPNIYAGPVFSFLLNNEYTTENPADKSGDLRIKSFDFGAAVGAGVNFHLSKGYIVTDFRYTFGMMDVCDTPEGGFEYQAQNGAFTALLGYGFMF